MKRTVPVVIAALLVLVVLWVGVATDAQTERVRDAPAARVRVPRPPRTAPPPRAPEPAAPEQAPDLVTEAEPGPEPEPAAGGGPVDRRGGDATDGEALREVLFQQMRDVTDEVLPCVERWAEADPDLDGAVTLRFGLDADGLQDVWIEDHDAVPGPLLECFAEAVWQGDWSGITPDPLEVSWPFHVTAD